MVNLAPDISGKGGAIHLMVLEKLIIHIKIIKIDLYLFHTQKSIEDELSDITIKGKTFGRKFKIAL